MSGGAYEAVLAIGLGFIGLTFWLYDRHYNRCPRCHTSFSRARAHQSAETNGLGLLERIERCPFCYVPLAATPDQRDPSERG